MDALKQFERQKYLNLETFGKSGEGVKTPVWFAQDGTRIYIQTWANTGKVKHIRNNGRVNIATCKIDGKIVGSWIPAHAREINDPEIYLTANRLLGRKFGVLKKCSKHSVQKKVR